MRGARPANGGRPADACQKLDTLGAYEQTKTATRPILVWCGQASRARPSPIHHMPFEARAAHQQFPFHEE